MMILHPDLRTLFSSVLLTALAATGASCAESFEPVRPMRPQELDQVVQTFVTKYVDRAVEAPSSAKAHGELGLLYEANGLWREALASYDQAAAIASKEPDWAYRAALATQQLGDLDRTLTRLESLVQAHPEFTPGLYRLADVLLESGDIAGADELFRKTLELTPRTPVCLIGVARAALKQREYEEARELLEEALRFDPRNKMAHALLSNAYRGLGRADDARRAAARGANAAKRFLADEYDGRLTPYVAATAPLLDMAHDLRKTGRKEESLQLLERAASERPDNVFVLHDQALTLISMNRPEEARVVLDKALLIDEENPRLLVKLGEYWIASGKPQRALEPANRAIRIDPQHGPSHFMKGRALMFLENYGEAYLALRDAEALDTDPQIDLALGAACMQLNLPIEAEKHLSEAVVQLPDNLQLHLDLCTTRIQSDDWKGAREALEDARTLDPVHPEIAVLEQKLAEAAGS